MWNFAPPFPDELWHLQAGGSSGELSGSGEAQVEAPWWSHRQQMALVNTVAFRGVWQKQFQFTNTQNLPFTRSDGSTIKVSMMYQATEVSFGKRVRLLPFSTDGVTTLPTKREPIPINSPYVCAGQFRTPADQRYTVLELPFLGRTLSLQVVLPSERKTPLSSLEAQLTARQVASWDFGLRRTKMDIFLPRSPSYRRPSVEDWGRWLNFFPLVFTGLKYRTNLIWGLCFLPSASVMPLIRQQLISLEFQVNISIKFDPLPRGHSLFNLWFFLQWRRDFMCLTPSMKWE